MVSMSGLGRDDGQTALRQQVLANGITIICVAGQQLSFDPNTSYAPVNLER